MRSHLLSIIIPVYNVEPYLEQCLDSVIGQSYETLEILIVDDASTDRSLEICERYAWKDKRIRVFRNKVNMGLSAARNLALDNAHGDYIGFVDSDDYLDTDMYDIMMKKIEEDGSDIAMCNYFWTNESGEPRSNYVAVNHGKKLTGISKIRENIWTINNCVWNKLFKRTLFESIRFPEGRLYEDIFIMHELFDKAESVSITDESLYYYRRRNSSITLRPIRPENLDIVDAYIAKYRYVAERYPTERSLLDSVTQSILTNLLHCVDRVVLEDSLNDEGKLAEFRPLIEEKLAEIDTLEFDLTERLSMKETLKKYALLQRDIRLYAYMKTRTKESNKKVT